MVTKIVGGAGGGSGRCCKATVKGGWRKWIITTNQYIGIKNEEKLSKKINEGKNIKTKLTLDCS
jgi:hypothetical protein